MWSKRMFDMSVGNPTPLLHMHAVERAAEDRGSPWFDRPSERYFHTILSRKVYPSHEQERTYFVSSDPSPYGPRWPRKYTIWVIEWSGCEGPRAIGGFQHYTKYRWVHSVAAELASLPRRYRPGDEDVLQGY